MNSGKPVREKEETCGVGMEQQENRNHRETVIFQAEISGSTLTFTMLMAQLKSIRTQATSTPTHTRKHTHCQTGGTVLHAETHARGHTL